MERVVYRESASLCDLAGNITNQVAVEIRRYPKDIVVEKSVIIDGVPVVASKIVLREQQNNHLIRYGIMTFDLLLQSHPLQEALKEVAC